jgi:hypothetical protein
LYKRIGVPKLSLLEKIGEDGVGVERNFLFFANIESKEL